MKKRARKWYPINFMGGLIVGLYGSTPAYMIYADSLGFLPSSARLFAMGGMLLVTAAVARARVRGHKLFSKNKQHSTDNGFTLVELLLVISIIGILIALILPVFSNARNASYTSRAKVEFRSFVTSLQLYLNNNNGVYPPDANRSIPAGLESYLATSGDWPNGPWPGSVYDWDAWAPSELSYEPKQQVYQISIRFCPVGQPTMCKFPNESWATGFGVNSSIYYCISGPCRAHSAEPLNYPGYCVNC